MDAERESRAGYVVPSYQAPDDTPWYHFLHGNVPGHQIDFIYRPEVPQGPLSRQHFSHLSRLMKYIEPQTNAHFAFAIGNLSRDDTQYEPGHGGVAIIFGLRIRGATDHAGRQDPPFAHGIAAIDRMLDGATLLTAAEGFYAHVLGAGESESWYRAYARFAREDPNAMPGVIEGYIDRFADLPQPEVSSLGTAWVTRGAPQPRRIVVAHEDDAPFSEIAAAAARIAAVLYRSDVRWTVISNGREDDVPNGVSIRLLPRSNLTAADMAGALRELSALPEDEAGVAELLFGATALVTGGAKPAATGWRARYSAVEAPSMPEAAERRPSWEGIAPTAPRRRRRDPTSGDEISVDVEVDVDALASTVVAPTAPASTQEREREGEKPTTAKGTSEPPAADRAAMAEVSIPVAPRVPDVAGQKVAPVPTRERAKTPVDVPAERPSTAKFWVMVIGFCAVAILVLVYLATQGKKVPPPEPPRPVVSALPSAVSTATPMPPVGTATAPPSVASGVPAPSAVPAPSGTPSSESKPSNAAGPRPVRPRATATSAILKAPLPP